MKPIVKLLFFFFLCCCVTQAEQIFNDIIPGHVFPWWMTRINMYTNEGEHDILKCFFKDQKEEGE